MISDSYTDLALSSINYSPTLRPFTQSSQKYNTQKPHKLSQTFHQSKSTMKLNLLLLSAAAALLNAATAIETVDLGTAGDYVILAKTGISTVPTSAITGDIAVSPISAAAITGFDLIMDSEGVFSTASQFTGKAYAADYASPSPVELTTAVGFMETAYTNAAGRPNDDAARINLGGGAIGGLVLTPGVYTFGVDISISLDVTFFGTDTDIFILQTTGSLLQAANTKVTLTGGALAKNIFWQVASLVDVGAGAHLEGVLLVKTAVTFKTGSSLLGRVLAQTACNLQMATITEA
jgi:hypothetical protein